MTMMMMMMMMMMMIFDPARSTADRSSWMSVSLVSEDFHVTLRYASVGLGLGGRGGQAAVYDQPNVR
jgi:hypothetical protein